jgi:hypothetical protein
MVIGLDNISCIHLLTYFNVNYTVAGINRVVCICFLTGNLARVNITVRNKNNANPMSGLGSDG